MKNKTAFIQIFLAMSAIIILVISGCGTKGLPLAPEIKGQKIATPIDLKYIIGEKEIILSWNHEIDNKNAFVRPDAFEVFMAKKSFDACVGCPFEFKTIGVVSMPSMEFVSKIEKGFKYYYRVQAFGEDDMRSPYSKTILFESK